MQCMTCDKEFDPKKLGWGCNDPECSNFTLDGANKQTKGLQNGLQQTRPTT